MKDIIETTDIAFAAYLKSKGYPLERILREGNRGTFYFSGVTAEVENAYNTGNSTVEPLAFHNAIKTLTTAARRAL